MLFFKHFPSPTVVRFSYRFWFRMKKKISRSEWKSRNPVTVNLVCVYNDVPGTRHKFYDEQPGDFVLSFSFSRPTDGPNHRERVGDPAISCSFFVEIGRRSFWVDSWGQALFNGHSNKKKSNLLLLVRVSESSLPSCKMKPLFVNLFWFYVSLHGRRCQQVFLWTSAKNRWRLRCAE